MRIWTRSTWRSQTANFGFLYACALAAAGCDGDGEEDEPTPMICPDFPDTTGTGGWDEAEDDGTDETGDDDAETSRFRVVHLGIHAPEVDLFLNGGEYADIEGLPFRWSTPYVSLPADSYTFDVTLAGDTIDASLVPAVPVNLENGGLYTLAFVGNRLTPGTAGTPDAGAPEMLVLKDEEQSTGEGVRLRLVHAASSLGMVDLYVVSDPAVPILLADALEYRASRLRQLGPGAHQLGVDTDGDAVMELVFAADLTAMDLSAGTFLNLFVSDDEEGNVGLLAQLADGVTLPLPLSP